jgi:1,4-dihydroxy-2-naphthoate octaprenyltransferase
MKPHTLSLVAPLLLTGCNVAAWGNLFVLIVTLALFCATLSLGRAGSHPRETENGSDSGTQIG